MARKPLIGITSDPSRLDWDDAKGKYYVRSVEVFGGEPIVLHRNGSSAEQVVSSLDGIIFSGGGDIHPRFYGELPDGVNERSISVERDQWEFELFEEALKLEKPILGICRGFQLINVALGGGLVQHVEGHRPLRRMPHNALYHPVCAEEDGWEDRCLVVNSFHHQAVVEEKLARNLTPIALLPRGEIVEAFRSRDGAPILGVQWHPERMPDYLPAKRRIFEWLLSEAKRRAK